MLAHSKIASDIVFIYCKRGLSVGYGEKYTIVFEVLNGGHGSLCMYGIVFHMS